MFESALSDKLMKIFDMKKVSFNLPSDMQEQETIFIEVDSSKNGIKDRLQVAKVTGKIRVFANQDKLPYGYFSKKIKEASNEDTKDMFFYNFEENAGTIQNITERNLGFIYFYTGQYDPSIGSITSLETGD